MPQNITDVNTFTTPIQSVADGDAANGANFLLGPQGLANRTYFLQQILQVTGVTVLRSGTAGTMTALTGMANGSIFMVPGRGIYVYTNPSSLTVDNRFVYASSVGGAQWVAVGTVGNGLIGTASASSSANPFTTASASFVDVTGASATLTVAIGDILDMSCSALCKNQTVSDGTTMRMAVVDGASTFAVGPIMTTTMAAAGVADQTIASSGFYTVLNAGTLTYKLQALAPAGTTAIEQGATINVRQIRP